MKITILLASFLCLLIFAGRSQVKITYTLDNHGRVSGEYYPDSLTVKETFDSASNIATETTTNPCFSRPKPVIIPSGLTTICLGDSVALVADSALSYLWSSGNTTRSIIVKQSGSFAVTTFGSLHCSKTSDTVFIKVNPLPIVSILASDSTSFCLGKYIILSSSLTGKYLWNTGDTIINIIADTTKNYVLQYTDSNGCKATASQKVTVYPKPKAAFIPNALAQCDGNNFVFTNTSTLSNGDKTFIWNLGEGLTDTSINQSHIYINSGNYTVTLLVTSDHNCKDSVAKNITVYPNPTPVISGAFIVCNNTNAIYATPIDSVSIYTWVVNGGNILTGQGTDSININWVAGGTGIITVTDSVKATGCKTTTIPYIVTINSATTSIIDTSICSGTSYLFNGNDYDSAGTFIVHLTSATGCDSVAILKLSVKQPSASRIDTSICKGSVYLFNGIPYDSTGIYVQHLSNAVGCDSTATLNLTVNIPTLSTTDTSICPSALPYHWNGSNYDSSGTYTTHLINKMGCDSIATLNLKINANSISTTDTSICPTALPYVWNGHSFDSTGSYTIHLTNSNGCDSVATLHLIVNATSSSTDSIRICTSYLWNGITYTASGIYTFNTSNSKGCDSIATLHLVIDTITTHTDSIKACNSYIWNNITYTTSGIYTFDTNNSKGCDSTATLILVINNSTSSTTNVSICPSALPYLWNNNSYTGGGIYTVHLTSKAGCDSAATLNLTVNATSVSTTNISICPSELPFHWNNNTYPTGGTYTVHLTNINGCDSTATLNLAVNAISSSNTDTSICPSALPFVWNAQSYTGAGTYTVHLFNIVGCDSVATLHLSIKTTSTSTTNASICSGGTYTFNGTVYTTAGTYTSHLINSVGCDSTATLNLTVNAETLSTTTMSICADTTPYKWNGNNYTASGIYTIHLTNAKGCDSAATLNLTIKATSSSTTNKSICDGDIYSFNGTNYTTAGIYIAHLTNVVGCDSAATLNLTIKLKSSSTTTVTICAGDSINFNGTVYKNSGTYISHLTNAIGCDSAATLVLTVIPKVFPSVTISTPSTSVCVGTTIIFSATAINGGTNPIYQWRKNGVTVIGAGNSATYTFTPGTLANNDTVSCLMTANNTCQTFATASSNKMRMIINSAPNIGVSTGGAICTIGGTRPIYNSNTDGGGVWTTDNPSVATITTANGATGTATATGIGTATMTYTKTGSNGCKSITSVVVTVAPQVTPTAIIAPSGICRGTTATLTDATPNGVWQCFNASTATISTQGVVTGINQGTALISYTVTNAYGCSNSATLSFPINAIPGVPGIGYAAGTPNPQVGPAGSFCLNKTFTVVGNPSGGVWSSTGVLSVNPLTGLVQTGAIAGGGSIIYTITVNGCSNNRVITGTTANCPNARNIDIDANKGKFDFLLSPNPAHNMVSITTKGMFSKGEIIITDYLGRAIKHQLLSLGVNNLDISKLSRGTYFVKVITDSSSITPMKLVVE